MEKQFFIHATFDLFMIELLHHTHYSIQDFGFTYLSGAIPFSRKHPLSCWVSSMCVIFAGSLLANLVMGEPMLSPLKNNNQLVLATAVW